MCRSLREGGSETLDRGQEVAVGNPPIPVTVRRSGRARRMTLRVSRLDGRVTLSVPPFVREAEARRFARSREAWLRKALDNVEAPVPVCDGLILPIEGREVRVSLHERNRPPVLVGDRIMVRPDRAGPALLAFLKARARDRLVAASDRYAQDLGENYAALTLRDTRSRWGSCSSQRRLMYSWRLIMAPPPVLDYVAAHEVAHLRRMDHSQEYWQIVDGLCPDHRACRAWLRENGPGLHRFRFRD